MICDACKGETFVRSQVTGNETPCNVCSKSGELTPCDNYDRGDTLIVFRNARCISCNVKQNDHIKVKA